MLHNVAQFQEKAELPQHIISYKFWKEKSANDEQIEQEETVKGAEKVPSGPFSGLKFPLPLRPQARRFWQNRVSEKKQQ